MGLLDGVIDRGKALARQVLRPDAVYPPQAPPTKVNDSMPGRVAGRARDTLVNMMAGLGTLTDHNATSFYAPIIRLNQIQISNAYEGSWLPRKIVDKRVEDMTREWVSVTWKDQGNDPAALRQLQDAEDRLNGRGAWTEALRWGFAFGGAGLILGVKGQNLWEPLDVERVGEGDLEWLMVRDRWYLTPNGDWVMEPGPNLGLPNTYLLTNLVAAIQTAPVHHSRVIRLGGDPLPMISWIANARWNDSVLQAPFSAVKRYDAIHGGMGQLIWEAKKDVISVDDLRTLLSYDGGEEELRKRFSAMAMASSLFNVTLLDAKDKYDRKQLSYSGLPEMMREFRSDVAGAAGYPITKLFGQSAGGMGSTGEAEDRTYYDDIKNRQNAIMRPGMHLYYRLLCRHVFGKEPQDLNVSFNPLWQMSEKDQGAVNLARAQMEKIHVDMGAIAPSLVARTEHANRTYEPMTEEDVEQVVTTENTPAPTDEETGGAGGGSGAPGGGGKDGFSLRDILRKRPDGRYDVLSENGEKHLGGPYRSKKAAMTRIRQIEWFKSHDVDIADATELQTIIFSKSRFNAGGAKAWLERNRKKSSSKRETAESLRYRQKAPEAFVKGSFRTIELTKGVAAVIGTPRLKNADADIVERRTFQGFNIGIENPTGSVRSWHDEYSNETGHTIMQHPYGFFVDHLGNDREELDCYLGHDEGAKEVHVVRQMRKPGYTRFDENKVFLGFPSADAAKQAYLAHRDDGDRAYGGMSSVPVEAFREKLRKRTGIGPIRS